MHTAQGEHWCRICLWCVSFLFSSSSSGPHIDFWLFCLCMCSPLKALKPTSSNLNSGHPGCTSPSPVAVGARLPHPLSPSPPVLLFPRWQGPRAPLFSILVGGRRALCLAAIVPDTRSHLTDTRAVKREREWRRRRRGHRWPLFSAVVAVKRRDALAICGACL